MKSTTLNRQYKENFGSFSCMQNNMKRKKRYETMTKLSEIDETPWGIRFMPKQQKEICMEEEKYEEEQHVPSPRLKISKRKQFHPSLKAVAKKPEQSQSCKRRIARMQSLSGQVEVRSSVMQRAEAVRENLDAKFPSFMKPMIRSNVTKGFWLSLPRLFCKFHLPDHDAIIVLEDENRKEFFTKYLAQRRGLSAGWIRFAVAHNLVEGDVLVFHMVKPNKLKVYIIRSSHLAEVDAALCLLHLDAPAKQKESGYRSNGSRGLPPAGIKNISFSQTVSENISDKDMPDNNMGLVINHPEKFGWDLREALKGLITETYNIANAVEASNLISSKRILQCGTSA